MYFVYILYSVSSNHYYVGHTCDVANRIHQHNHESENSFTSKHRPWVLKAAIPISVLRADAMKVEAYIKAQKRKTFIELVIQKQSDESFLLWLKLKAVSSSVG